MTSIKPVLEEQQVAKVSEVQDKLVKVAGGPMQFTADMALRRFLDLESTFLKLSAGSNISPEQLAQVGELYREGVTRRNEEILNTIYTPQGIGRITRETSPS